MEPIDRWTRAWIDTGLSDWDTNIQNILPPQLPSRRAPLQSRLARPPPQPIPAATQVIYTDGSGPATRDEHHAGWGFAVVSGGDGVVDEDAAEIDSASGRVSIDATDSAYLGATSPTNNTAELTAIAKALEFILAGARLVPYLLRYDSIYAANMAAGKWRPRKNKELVRRVRSLWRQAHRHTEGQLWASHVYGHTNHKWNDRADELANIGKRGSRHEYHLRRRPARGDG